MQWRGERSGRGRPAGKKVVKDVEREQRKNGKGGELSRGERERTERARGEGLEKKWGGWKESELCEKRERDAKKGWDGICSPSRSQGAGTAVREFGFSLNRKKKRIAKKKNKNLCATLKNIIFEVKV